MVESIGSGVTAVIGWFGNVADAIITPEGALYSLLGIVGIGCAVRLTMKGLRVVRGLIWGA